MNKLTLSFALYTFLTTAFAADVYAPISGDIVEVNNALEDDPEIVNRDAFGEGWIFKINVSNESEIDELMDADSYQEICPES